MKRSNTIVENIEFLISMYKRELKIIEEAEEKGKATEEQCIEEECYQCIIDELETIIELSK